MVTKVLTETTFIHGRLAYAGEEVDLDANEPGGYALAASTPVGQLSVEQLLAQIARIQSKEGQAQAAEPAFSANVTDPGNADVQVAGRMAAPIADIAPRSAGTTQPQGVPSGYVQTTGGQFVQPSPAGDPSPTQVAVADTPEGRALGELPDLPQLDHDHDGKPGGSLSKAEIIKELETRQVAHDPKATRAELAELLASPPQA